MSSIGQRQTGFTLVELLISMAIAGIVMAAVYTSYYSQQKAYVVQEQVVAMQQNLRAALFHLERDIRMAGYDPTGAAGAGILVATTDPPRFQLTKDDNNDSDGREPDGDRDDLNENIDFELNGQRITRNDQPIAENIDALDFVYLNESGAVLTSPVNISAIRSVQISIVARTAKPDPGYTDSKEYRNLQNEEIYTPTGNDLRFRRNMLRVEVRCRNIGIS